MIKESLENKLDKNKVNQKISYLKTVRDNYNHRLKMQIKKKKKK